jgi:cobalt/nickel transport system permease protein
LKKSLRRIFRAAHKWTWGTPDNLTHNWALLTLIKEIKAMFPSPAYLRAKSLFKKVPRGLVLYFAVIGVWLTTTAMHIPDGYLSPVTSLVMFLVILPFWYLGLKKLREKMNARSAPLIALLAAFAFVIMMFNVPLPGGTTGHAVGGALAAIILGPEIATIAVSIALIIQAFFFGDGGILAIGANCFNMGVVLPYVSYAIYQYIGGKYPVESSRRLIGAFLGGWIALTVAAFFAGFEFGLQPLLFHAADGTPLYAPYPLSVAIPATVVPHLLVASVIEGALTALVVAYLQRANRPILEVTANPTLAAEAASFGRLRALWVGLAVLIIATPLGLLAPGTAWGEWGSDQLANLGLGFVPQGLAKLETLWGAPLAGYDLPALGNSNLGYVLSAVVGIVLIAIVAWLFTALLTSGSRSAAKNQN